MNTQKWIAIYPDGSSGWTEWRRTGYPIFSTDSSGN
ncbi:MAG: SusD/RagB family nutrient-binding outer membrane lipoprotein [Saprospiraceae bacterium]|nr:SusD/RagB family nutrient-binding outer membrane lipoprotein [Saprospiraceae bacterium]